MTNTNEFSIGSRFNFASSCFPDTFGLSSMPSYTPVSTGSYTVLPHLFGFVLAQFRYVDKSHVDVLLSAVVNSRAVKGAIVKDSNSELIDTSSNLNLFSSGGTLRIIPNNSFHVFVNNHSNESSQMNYF